MKESDDPIVAEVRKAGEDLFKRFDNDLAAVFAHLQQRTEEAARQGRAVVSLPPSRVEAIKELTKKAG